MQIMPSRRDFLAGASLAAAAGVLGARRSLADEGPPETTTIRLGYWPTYALPCPRVDFAEELLRAEGFTDIRYVPPSDVDSVAGGEIDLISMPRQGSSLNWMPARRSRRWRVCIPAATSCSCTSPSEPSAT